MPRTHATFFKMLSARSRVHLLQLLAERGELSVEELGKALDLTLPTVSRHLQLLRMQELVTVRPEAQNRFYSLNKETIAEKMASFLDLLAIELPARSQATIKGVAEKTNV